MKEEGRQEGGREKKGRERKKRKAGGDILMTSSYRKPDSREARFTGSYGGSGVSCGGQLGAPWVQRLSGSMLGVGFGNQHPGMRVAPETP